MFSHDVQIVCDAIISMRRTWIKAHWFFQSPTDPPLALRAMAAKNEAPSEATTTASPAAGNAGLAIEAMQAAGDTGMPAIHELATLASASASLTTQAQAGNQPRTGHVNRQCQGSSASMVAHASMTNEAGRLSHVADADNSIGDMQQQAVFMPICVIMQQPLHGIFRSKTAVV